MGLPPLSKIPFILRPQAWLHRRHYGEVLSPIRWWGRIPCMSIPMWITALAFHSA